MNIPNFRPLACSSAREKDEAWESDDYIAEEKFDGSRYLFIKDDKGVRFLSRHISVKTGKLVVKTEQVPHLVKELAFIPNGTVLDGEIYQRGKKSNYITSIMGSLPARAQEIQRNMGFLDYAIFDMPFYNGKDLRKKPLSKRKAMIEKALALGVREHVKFARYEQKNKYEFYRTIVENENGEGVILKSLSSEYNTLETMKRERRSLFWRKAKRFDTYDCVIVGFTLPNRLSVNVLGEETINKNYANRWISGIIIAQYVEKEKFDLEAAKDLVKNYPYPYFTYKRMITFCRQNEIKHKNKIYVLQPFTVTIGMNEEMRKLFTKYRRDYLGKVVEIGAQERTATGSFRHPRFVRMREDKLKNYCIYRHDES